MQVFILCTLNNTIVSVQGGSISAGKVGFEGAKRGTMAAAEMVGIRMGEFLHIKGVKTIEVKLSGIFHQGLAVLKGLRKQGVEVLLVEDHTPIPHNGCRLPKKRRI
jgi:small subunit ribosomal protein S11